MSHIPLDLLPDHHLPRLITVDTGSLPIRGNLTAIARSLAHKNPVIVARRLRMRLRVLLFVHLRAASGVVVRGPVPRSQLRHVVADGVACAAIATAVSTAVAIVAFGRSDASESGV